MVEEESEHTLVKFMILYGHSSWHPQTMTIVNTKRQTQITTTNIITMKKSQIFQELPKCDSEKQSEQMLLEILHQQTARPRVATNLQVLKKHNFHKVQ